MSLQQSYSTEADYLGEFCDPVNYDLEEGSDTLGRQFYAALAEEVGGPVLELACGTGLATLPIARRGIAITGLEIVPAMLAHARHKADEEGLAVRWVAGDARTFTLDERFRLIFLTGNAFQAFLNNADQQALLQRVHAHLATDGLFAFETRNPKSDDLTTDLTEEEWLVYTNAQGHEVHVSEIREYDPIAQLLVYTLWRRWQEGMSAQVRTTRIAIRYTFPQELRALLASNGFQILHQYGDWDRSPLTPTSPSMITICVPLKMFTQMGEWVK